MQVFQRKVLLTIGGMLLLLNIFLWKEVFLLAGPQFVMVKALDIGQGDAVFIKTPSNRRILIDGGPTNAILGKLKNLMPFWGKSLDVVMLTHPDADHLNGLLEVLKVYSVDYIIWSGVAREGEAYEIWLELLEQQKSKGAKVIALHQGGSIQNGAVALTVVSPLESVVDKIFPKGVNDTSLVSRLSYGNTSFLFTGDISSDAEKVLIDSGLSLTSDILKIPHHGSRYSSSAAFLEAVKPSAAVILAGRDNSYGHPTPEVLQRLQNFGITTFRTDTQGDITLISDGSRIVIQ